MTSGCEYESWYTMVKSHKKIASDDRRSNITIKMKMIITHVLYVYIYMYMYMYMYVFIFDRCIIYKIVVCEVQIENLIKI